MAGENWLTGWDYRKSHLITASAGAGTGYQVGIKVYKTTGTDGTETVNGVTMGKVYVGSDCLDNFNDIRFTDDDGDTLLDFWLDPDYLVSATSAVFWVEVKDTLESNATIYVYYGNSGAASASNGANTFLLFDHFDDTSLDVALWTEFEYGGGTVTEPAGTDVLLDVAPGVTNQNAGIQTVATFTNGVAMLAKRKQAADNGYYIGMSLGAGPMLDDAGGIASLWQLSLRAGYWCRHYNKGGDSSEIYENPTPKGAPAGLTTANVNGGTCNVYAIWEMRYDENGKIDWRIDGTSKASATDTTFLTTAKYFLVNQGSYNGGAYGSDTSVDYVIVRKLIATEPAHSTWGDEEEPPSVLASPASIVPLFEGLCLSQFKPESFNKRMPTLKVRRF